MTVHESKAKLHQLVAGAQLPALPQSAIRIMELSQDPENGPYQFARPIESDPGLTSQVLRFVNSSYFGFRQEISSVNLAISLVGVRTIKNFALWSAVFSLLPNPKCGLFDLKSLWQDSLRRGIFARRLAKRLQRPEAEDLFAPALLQDMALPLLAKELPDDYHRLFTARQGGTRRLSHLEHDTFGWTHCEAGALMARRWRLPDFFSELISRHATEAASGTASSPARQVVGLSALLPAACDSEWADRETFLSGFKRLTAHAEMSLHEFLAQVDAEFAEFAPLLKLAQPSRLLADYLATEAVLS